ncbi:MAG: metallophosphoesterase [Candidatus Parvarchaeota archaeon]|nr:metallophosphoesterase [Candidatus Parvarchaeota archaeon]
MNRQDLDKLFSNGVLVDASVEGADIKNVDDLISKLKAKGTFILDSSVLHDLYSGAIEEDQKHVDIIKNYEGETSASKPADWAAYFNDRFNRLREMLVVKENGGLMSLSQVKGMPSGSDVKFIAMISNVSISPIKKFMILDIEDNTTSYRALSSTIREEVLQDQVVVIKGKKSKDAVFVDSIILPDIAVKEQTDKNMPDSYAVFISDIHVGSKLFARESFEKLIKWLNLEIEEYSNIAKAVDFIILAGDLVDGIGVYPDQEKELEINDLKAQYEELYKILDRIPKRIKLIISQGNHDATHIAEPQPRLDPAFGDPLYQLDNAMFLSNPYQVNLVVGQYKTNLLVYHGFSIPYYANTISKYNKMNTEDIEAIMKLHLRSRHVAPTHGSTQVVPLQKDYLVIDETPDIYVTGHIHKALLGKYKGTVLVNSSCWQYQTSYQKKYDIVPEIAKVVLVNLKNKEGLILDFLGERIQIYKKAIKD